MTIAQLKATLQNAHNKLPITTMECIDIVGKDLVERAKAITPVDTGRLKRSWETELTREGERRYILHIYNDARNPNSGKPYAKYVEYGHYSVAGNWVAGRFMLTNTMPEAVDILRKAIRGSVQGLMHK